MIKKQKSYPWGSFFVGVITIGFHFLMVKFDNVALKHYNIITFIFCQWLYGNYVVIIVGLDGEYVRGHCEG